MSRPQVSHFHPYTGNGFDKDMLASEIDANAADIEILEVEVDVDLGHKKSWYVTYALHTDPTPRVHSAFVFTVGIGPGQEVVVTD